MVAAGDDDVRAVVRDAGRLQRDLEPLVGGEEAEAQDDEAPVVKAEPEPGACLAAVDRRDGLHAVGHDARVRYERGETRLVHEDAFRLAADRALDGGATEPGRSGAWPGGMGRRGARGHPG